MLAEVIAIKLERSRIHFISEQFTVLIVAVALAYSTLSVSQDRERKKKRGGGGGSTFDENTHRILHGKCGRTVFTHELLTYQKLNE